MSERTEEIFKREQQLHQRVLSRLRGERVTIQRAQDGRWEGIVSGMAVVESVNGPYLYAYDVEREIAKRDALLREWHKTHHYCGIYGNIDTRCDLCRRTDALLEEGK